MKELIEALKVIKEECKKHEETCTDCPMYKNGQGCLVRYQEPEYWAINDEPMKVLL